MINLQGHRIFVVGGSRGIGRGAATMCAEAGADVAVGYGRDHVAAGAVVRQVESLGRRGLALACDVTDEVQTTSAIDEAARVLGGLDGLVVSAGIFERAPISEMTLEFWNRTLAVNLTGTFLAIKAALPHLRRSAPRASIVIYTSTAGQGGNPTYSAYAATKGGQIVLMKSLARELAGERVRVNCIAPAWTDTDMARNHVETNTRAKVDAGFPLGRMGQPSDVAGATVYLLSDAAQFVTGITLTVDGGKDMRG